LCAFTVAKLDPNDVCTLLDKAGVATRNGTHCTQPLHRCLGVGTTARASLYLYNTAEEVDVFIDALKDTIAFVREITEEM